MKKDGKVQMLERFPGKPYHEIKNICQWVESAKHSITKWQNILSCDYYSDEATSMCGLCLKARTIYESLYEDGEQQTPFICKYSGCPLYYGNNKRINLNCCYHKDELKKVFDLDETLSELNPPEHGLIEKELKELCQIAGKRIIGYLIGLVEYAERSKV